MDGNASNPEAEITHVYGGPTKRFFVSMLTRDIELDDAILDLLDNSVDGAMRTNPAKVHSPNPFMGFRADLTLTKAEFKIEDNCGGIPREYLADAFSLGRPNISRDGDLPTIGMYGIGMKRAIFKIGKSASVVSSHGEANVLVSYSEEWLDPENDEWELPVEESPIKLQELGVSIEVDNLKADVANQFDSLAFVNRLSSKIAEHFGYIMQKGFEVTVNGAVIRPITLPLISAKPGAGSAIRAFDYVTKIDEVYAEVTIGFFRPLVREREIDEETNSATTSERAGISVVCNDRVVLLHDRSIKTGWGEGGVPRFHPQFRAIAGLIVLSSNNPSKLPISTTKRDLDAGSEIYLKVRQACVEGLKVFTDFTNKWKGMEDATTEFFDEAPKRDVRREIRWAADHGTAVRGEENAKKYKPVLPLPVSKNPRRRITFLRDNTEIEQVSLYLFQGKSEHPSIVGNGCFEAVLKESKG